MFWTTLYVYRGEKMAAQSVIMLNVVLHVLGRFINCLIVSATVGTQLKRAPLCDTLLLYIKCLYRCIECYFAISELFKYNRSVAGFGG